MGSLKPLSLALVLLAWAASGAAARADEPTFSLTIKDHQFVPAELEIPVDTKVRLLIKNADATAEEFDSSQLRREKVIPGGQEGTIFVGPLKAGVYEFVGEFNPKTAKGRIVVK